MTPLLFDNWISVTESCRAVLVGRPRLTALQLQDIVNRGAQIATNLGVYKIAAIREDSENTDGEFYFGYELKVMPVSRPATTTSSV